MSLILVLLIAGAMSTPAEDDTVLASFGERWSLKRLVEVHQKVRPLMQVQDVYKLLYQAHFGVGHLMADSDAVRAYLVSEMESISSNAPDEPLVERISTGGEIVRVNLLPFLALNLLPDVLVESMAESAAEWQSDSLMFHREWNEFCSLVRYGLLKFSLEEVIEWDRKVQTGQIEPVHHSKEYSDAYHPAYRVVQRRVFESQMTSVRSMQ